MVSALPGARENTLRQPNTTGIAISVEAVASAMKKVAQIRR